MSRHGRNSEDDRWLSMLASRNQNEKKPSSFLSSFLPPFLTHARPLSPSLPPPLSIDLSQLGSILINLGTVRSSVCLLARLFFPLRCEGGKGALLSLTPPLFPLSFPLSLFPSLSLSLSLSLSKPNHSTPPLSSSKQNLMKLGHNKSLALEEFQRSNAPASPSSSTLPPPSSSLGGGKGSSAKLQHRHRSSSKPRPARSFREWQAGIALFAAGNVLNFVSFGFAAQSLLAALGSVQFVSNVVFARLVLKEAVTWRVLGATALIVTGASKFFSCL